MFRLLRHGSVGIEEVRCTVSSPFAADSRPSTRMSLLLHVVGPTEGSPHTHTIILLHGRDSEAGEFALELFECEATGLEADRTLTALFPTIRWVFPQATALRSERFATDMSQWFDIWALEDLQERSELQVSGLWSSVDLVIKTIKDEELLVPRDRIFLGGISQGFAMHVPAPLFQPIAQSLMKLHRS